MPLFSRLPSSGAVLAILLAACLAAGCASKDKRLDPNAPIDYNKTDAQLQEEAAYAYMEARKSLDNQDFQAAEKAYSFVAQRYPFTEFGTQAELERIYAFYRGSEPDRAISAAEKFLRDHPRHARADYVHYLKGLINSDRNSGVMAMLGVDDTRVDVSYDRAAFDDFALMVQRYPSSPYIGDARQRMIHLRNRIASHEYAIAEFYYGRGAYVAAAERSSNIIARYPGAPHSYLALDLMERSYRRAGLLAQADDAHRILQAQPLGLEQAQAALLPGEDSGPGIWSRIGHALTFGLFRADDAPVETQPGDAPPPAA